MPHLVGNGTHLYRRSILVGGAGGISHTESHLVSTPIWKYVTVQPDRRQYYPVAGAYDGNGLPTHGVVGDPADQYAAAYRDASVRASATMRNYALQKSGSPQPQGWRNVSSDDAAAAARQSIFVFYDGGHATSCPVLTDNPFRPEAYMQIPALHFTLPDADPRFHVGSVALRVRYNGTLIKCSSATGSLEPSDGMGRFLATAYHAVYAPDDIIDTSVEYENSWRNPVWTQRVGLFQTVNNNTYNNLHNVLENSVEDIALNTGDVAGNGYEAMDFWDFGNGAYGKIPTCLTKWEESIQLGGGMISKFDEFHTTGNKSARGGWLVCMPPIVRGNNGSPSYIAPPAGTYGEDQMKYWLCCSFTPLFIEVGLVINP